MDLLPERVDFDGRVARLQEVPVVLQLRAVDLRPGLDKALLRLWQATAKAFNRVDGWCCPPVSTNIRMMIPKNRESSAGKRRESDAAASGAAGCYATPRFGSVCNA